ncbi:protein phosphatase 1 regulatory subunit 3A isoform X1 [Hippoglossus stenolepis]|uniref:protein phosphatase 1 regulatory subunit 3A isoform X1 n=1 Tax=Hippoglossus stenolepis TaxID=195615 RepID=UPI00159C15EF|nr:protein phosphatase 1 regulatory subunit 3A isoform X1 [Hippoglossus stenolepis]
MSFLTIPNQEGLFTTIKNGKSAEGVRGASSMYDDDNNHNEEEEEEEEEDDDDPEGVRFIPRCSPVPRKRGASIHDETAEYMCIHLALSAAAKKVWFADTTGGDLVDVKEFVAFDSDDEVDSARWEEEEAKYRKPWREPTYRVQPEFTAPAGGALLQAVRSGKVEVEQVTPVEDDPLAFCGLIRVLNVSFHKAVYIRSTMDNWVTYFDHPAEYVQDSNEGDTDRFSFKLSFAPPYVTHGSRIEFVVRYETADGDFWANNSSMNYVLTLLLSYEDDAAPTDIDVQDIRGILKPPRYYSMNDDEFDSEDEQEKEEEETGTSKTGLIRPTAVCPVIVQPEIDLEIAVNPPGPSAPPNHELPSVDGTLSAHTESPVERSPCTSSQTTLQTNSSFVLCASESVQPNKSQPLPRLHCELVDQTSAQPGDSSPSPLLPPLQQESRPRSDSSQADGEEIPSSEASRMQLPTTETDLWPTGEDRSTESPASRPRLQLAAAPVSAPGATQRFEREAALGLSEPAAGLTEGSTRSAAHCEDGTLPSPVAESQAALGAEGEAPPSPELTENAPKTTGVTEACENSAPPPAWACGEKGDAPQISPDTSVENLSNTLSEASEHQSAIHRNLMPSIVFLSGVVSLSIVMQEPSALFFIGLLLVLHRL